MHREVVESEARALQKLIFYPIRLLSVGLSIVVRVGDTGSIVGSLKR
jgi:hypothetical protein